MSLENDGYFFAEASTVGAEDEEIKLGMLERLPMERQASIRFCTEEAMLALARAEPRGRC